MRAKVEAKKLEKSPKLQLQLNKIKTKLLAKEDKSKVENKKEQKRIQNAMKAELKRMKQEKKVQKKEEEKKRKEEKKVEEIVKKQGPVKMCHIKPVSAGIKQEPSGVNGLCSFGCFMQKMEGL